MFSKVICKYMYDSFHDFHVFQIIFFNVVKNISFLVDSSKISFYMIFLYNRNTFLYIGSFCWHMRIKHNLISLQSNTPY